MNVDTKDLISAGSIEPDGLTIYEVCWFVGRSASDDEIVTLLVGDKVRMVQTPTTYGLGNVFLRESDFTLHPIRFNDAYVLVRKVKKEVEQQ